MRAADSPTCHQPSRASGRGVGLAEGGDGLADEARALARGGAKGVEGLAHSREDEEAGDVGGARAREVSVEAVADHEGALRAHALGRAHVHRGLGLARAVRLDARRRGDDADEAPVARGEAAVVGKREVEVRREEVRARADRVGRLGELAPSDVGATSPGRRRRGASFALVDDGRGPRPRPPRAAPRPRPRGRGRPGAKRSARIAAAAWAAVNTCRVRRGMPTLVRCVRDVLGGPARVVRDVDEAHARLARRAERGGRRRNRRPGRGRSRRRGRRARRRRRGAAGLAAEEGGGHGAGSSRRFRRSIAGVLRRVRVVGLLIRGLSWSSMPARRCRSSSASKTTSGSSS